jgi:feruloyl esterase
MVFEDPNWDFRTFDFDRDLKFAIAKLSHILDATNPYLTGFKKRGGKLIQYHGWLDGSPPPGHSVEYYKRVAKSGGLKNTQAFYRLFMVAGMMHCSGGPGPNNFGNTRASGSQGLDPDRNIFVALERWVERGIAPDKIIATKYVDDDPKKAVTMTCPLCPYPQQASWTGKGSTDAATNFVCRASRKQAKAGALRIPKK